MPDEIQQAWQRAQDAWVAAGKVTPCFEPRYMDAREELAKAHDRAIDTCTRVANGGGYQMADSVIRKMDLVWIDADRLAIERHGNGVVTIHQRDHISRDKWCTLIVSVGDLKALARAAK